MQLVAAVAGLAALAVGLLNAWVSLSVKSAVLELELKLTNRIASTEGDVKALVTRVNGAPPHVN